MIRRILAMALALVATTSAAQGVLVDAGWLRQALERADPRLVVLDASPSTQRRAGVVPGSHAAEPWRYLLGDTSAAGMQRVFRAWGLHADSRVVVLDQGASWEAARLFYDLQRHGVAPGRLHLLDGGLAAWRAAGGAVQAGADAAAPAPRAGELSVAEPDPAQAVTLAEVLHASGRPGSTRLVDALEPAYFAGSARFFDRGGHLPHARNWPVSQFYDREHKTFRPLSELQALAAHLGLTREVGVITYCGGGGAAAVPWFVLTQLLGHADTRLYTGSIKEWVQDPRGLPLWTHAEPALQRSAAWAGAWAGGMLRRVGQSLGTVVDVRDAGVFSLAHLPDALNLPAQDVRALLHDPGALARRLQALGLDPAHEAVVASDGGLNREAALVWLALQRAGQASASLLMDSPERAAEQGMVLDRGSAPQHARPAGERRTLLPAPAQDELPGLPLQRLAAGEQPPQRLTVGAGQPLLHLPWRELVDADGVPRAAGEIRAAMTRAGLPPMARVEVVADDPGDAAAGLYLLRLMGYRHSDARWP